MGEEAGFPAFWFSRSKPVWEAGGCRMRGANSRLHRMMLSETPLPQPAHGPLSGPELLSYRAIEGHICSRHGKGWLGPTETCPRMVQFRDGQVCLTSGQQGSMAHSHLGRLLVRLLEWHKAVMEGMRGLGSSAATKYTYDILPYVTALYFVGREQG